jgi:hypothetical protein
VDSKRNRSAAKRRKKLGRTENQFDLRTEAYKLVGVDVIQIPALETNVSVITTLKFFKHRFAKAGHR